jgi:hypothetical protein
MEVIKQNFLLTKCEIVLDHIYSFLVKLCNDVLPLVLYVGDAELIKSVTVTGTGSTTGHSSYYSQNKMEIPRDLRGVKRQLRTWSVFHTY